MSEFNQQEIGKLKEELERTKAELAAARPKIPQPHPLEVDPQTTALLVLDLSARWADPGLASSKMILGIKDFLVSARAHNLYIIFTVSAVLKGKPEGVVFEGFKCQPREPVIFPDGYDKFSGGELQDLLKGKGINTVIVTGSLSNIAVMYTATTAARSYRYKVIIPVDGISANSSYEQEYTIYQLSVLPGGVGERISFTNLKDIFFRKP